MGEGAPREDRAVRVEAVGATGGVGGDGLCGVGDAGAEADEVRAENEVRRCGFGLEGDAAAEEGDELVVGVLREGAGKEGGVEVGVDGLVEVEGEDRLALAVVAEVPDGGAAVVAGARVKGGGGYDEGVVVLAAGVGAESGALLEVQPLLGLPGGDAGDVVGSDDVGGWKGCEAGAGGGLVGYT